MERNGLLDCEAAGPSPNVGSGDWTRTSDLRVMNAVGTSLAGADSGENSGEDCADPQSDAAAATCRDSSAAAQFRALLAAWQRLDERARTALVQIAEALVRA